MENQGCTVHGCDHRPLDEPDVTITPEQAAGPTHPTPMGTPPVLTGSTPFNPPIQQHQSFASPDGPNTHPGTHLMPLSIVSTICCCSAFYFGIAAIYYSNRIEICMRIGDMHGAHDAARQARLWCWITLGVGLPLNLVLLAMFALD